MTADREPEVIDPQIEDPVVGRKILVIALVSLEEPALRTGLQGSEVRVVSPASKLSPVQWLTNEEDDARADAEERAERTAEKLPDGTTSAEVGDVDPVQAAEDALREFDAEEILVVVPAGDEASWLDRASLETGFERFGLPVHYVSSGR